MDKSLPFEYGFLYKPITDFSFSTMNAEEISKAKNEIIKGVQMDMDWPNYSNNGYGQMMGNLQDRRVDESRFYSPIGFIESKQIVVCNVMVKEYESITGFQYMNSGSLSFQSGNLFIQKTIVGRVRIDVHVFIKYFEKVL